MSPLGTVVLAVVVTTVWLAAYRLPFADLRRANKVGLALSTWTTLRPDLAFAIFGTALYIGLGFIGSLIVISRAGVDIAVLFTAGVSIESLAATLVALVGAMSSVSLGSTVLYKLEPQIDIPGSIRRVRWIAAIEALPKRMRFTIPTLGALVEEIFFRGIVYSAVKGAGGNLWLAFATATALFVIGQIVITDNQTAAIVIGFSSIVISVFGTLLIIVSGNIIPALIVHMSFAGFYSSASWVQS